MKTDTRSIRATLLSTKAIDVIRGASSRIGGGHTPDNYSVLLTAALERLTPDSLAAMVTQAAPNCKGVAE